MAKSVLYLATYFDVLSVSKRKTELSKISGLTVTNEKLRRYSWNGITYVDEYLSLKLHQLFPNRVPLQQFVKTNGIIQPMTGDNIDL